MTGTDWWTLAVIAGLGLVTMVTRSFFFISNKPWPLPGWVERGLKYAPIAALSAVVAPEIVMLRGELVGTLADARIFGAIAGAAAYLLWKRNVLATIGVGMAVYLPLHLLLGW